MNILLKIFVILLAVSCVHSLPNFILLLADDLGYGDVGCFGNHSIKTPNIDKLASNGVKLMHHVTAAAVCTPSRAALLTGRYPVRSGMSSSRRNKVFFFVAASGGLPETEITFSKAIKEKGYSTAIVGKWHLGNDCTKKGDGCHHPLNHGFDYFYGLPLSNFKDMGDSGESVITAYNPHFYDYISAVIVLGITVSYFLYSRYKILSILILTLFVIFPIAVCIFLLNLKTINGVVMHNKEVVEQPVRLTGLTQRFVSKAQNYIRQQSSVKKTFLLYLPFVHVHTALFCTDKFKGRSAHGSYGDNVEELDWAIGELMKTLKDENILNDTFVYFSSDNGAHVEEVGINGEREGGFNGVLRGGKLMGGMEGGIRVPSVISWPSKVPVGEINTMTSQMDIFPTLMDIVGLPAPKDRVIDGKSLLPVLKERTRSHHQILFHYCAKTINAATYIDGVNKWKIHWITPKFLPGTSRCEYICHCFGDFVVHHDPPLMYNLATDVSESNPISIESDKKYKEILSVVNKLKEEHGRSLENVTDQFSFSNFVWKPWLQPCCNFPYCKCKDPDFED